MIETKQCILTVEPSCEMTAYCNGKNQRRTDMKISECQNLDRKIQREIVRRIIDSKIVNLTPKS
jgi:hypothetical protein